MSSHAWRFGAGQIQGLDVTMGDVSYTPKVKTVEILDTSVMPMTVLERRVTQKTGELKINTCETSQASLLGDVLSQSVISVSFEDYAGGGISMAEATLTAATITWQLEDYAKLSLTFESLGTSDPVVT